MGRGLPCLVLLLLAVVPAAPFRSAKRHVRRRLNRDASSDGANTTVPVVLPLFNSTNEACRSDAYDPTRRQCLSKPCWEAMSKKNQLYCCCEGVRKGWLSESYPECVKCPYALEKPPVIAPVGPKIPGDPANGFCEHTCDYHCRSGNTHARQTCVYACRSRCHERYASFAAMGAGGAAPGSQLAAPPTAPTTATAQLAADTIAAVTAVTSAAAAAAANPPPVVQPLSLVQLGSSRSGSGGGAHEDLSMQDMKQLRGELEDLTSELVERRKQKLLAKRLRVHQQPSPASSAAASTESASAKSSAAPAPRAVPAADTASATAPHQVAPSVEAGAVAQQQQQQQQQRAKLVAPSYRNPRGAAPAASQQPRFASAKAQQSAKSKTGDDKNPWWLNPPPWWLPPPPEWGAPPPSIYSGFYNPYSQPQSFHRTPAAHPAYNPYPLPY